MTAYRCPSCHGEIEVSDTSTSVDQAILVNPTRISIETRIVHKELMREDCVVLLRMFIDEQVEGMRRVLGRIGRSIE